MISYEEYKKMEKEEFVVINIETSKKWKELTCRESQFTLGCAFSLRPTVES